MPDAELNWATHCEVLVSKANRKHIPVRTFGGDKVFHVSLVDAQRMLNDRRAFRLADDPLELQIVHGGHVAEPGRPDLSLTMPASVIHGSAVGSEPCRVLVEGYANVKKHLMSDRIQRRIRLGLSLAEVSRQFRGRGCSPQRISAIERASHVHPETIQAYDLALEAAIAQRKKLDGAILKIRAELEV
jgi:hypothetical protein